MIGLQANAPLFFLGSGLSALCAWALLSRRPGWGLDHPDEARKMHLGPKPRTGGLALFVAWIVIGWFQGQPAAIWLGGVLLFLLGFCDDLVRVDSRRKLLVQVAAAALTHALGLRIESWPFFSGTVVDLPWMLSFSLTLLWLVGWTNAMNLIDGLDGLATGIVMIGMGFLSVLTPGGGGMAWGMAGAAAGFLLFNFPRARMFLGDGGAYLSGFLFAAWALVREDGRGIPFLATVLCVPLLDTVHAFLRRLVRRRPVLRGDAEHIHHQLLALGWKGPVVTIVLHLGTVLSGAVAWQALRSGGDGWGALLQVLAAGAAVIWYLAVRPTPGGAAQNSSANPASSSVAGSETVSNSST